MTRLDAYASRPHYLDHLLPVWEALRPDLKGTLYVSRAVEARATLRGIAAKRSLRGSLTAPSGPILVAGPNDLTKARRRPAVYIEHGAGQAYVGTDNPSYAGGEGRDRVELFLCPSEEVAARNLARYPDARVAVVGAPILDRYTLRAGRFPEANERAGRRNAGLASWLEPRAPGRAQRASSHRDGNEPSVDSGADPTIAISFHWDCHLLPETRWAFPHYRRALPELARAFPTIGHAHPRVWRHLETVYRGIGVEPVEEFSQVVRRATCYVADNSSTIYEAAACGIPVVLLNAPWYRRHVEHGLRFWERADVGVQVDDPAGLVDAIALAIEDPEPQRKIREQRVAETYTFGDGSASERAAAAIEDYLLEAT